MPVMWINSILVLGYRGILSNLDLPPLSQDVKPEFTRETTIRIWSQRVEPITRLSLPKALFKSLRGPFFAAVIPRSSLIVFRYAQPLLIRESIKFVSIGPTEVNSNRGHWLIASAMVIYTGLALSTVVYQHRINRLMLMTKSTLIALIYDKIIGSQSTSYDSGEAIALMSTDVDSLEGIAGLLHETWAQAIEVLVGIVLLASQVGWIWPLPLFLIYLCSHMSRFVAKQLQPRQRAWNLATQYRLATISSMLSAIKSVKMLGYQQSLMQRIQKLRSEELQAASKLRWIMVYYNASANALGIFTPAITIALYAAIAVATGGTLNVETAFTTTAILSMVTHPANMIMTVVPRIVAAFAGFDRIQAYLLRHSSADQRGTASKCSQSRLIFLPPTVQHTNLDLAIQIRQLSIGIEPLILDNINIDVILGSFVILSGPTGSGKSTLLRAILGEVEFTHGSIDLSTRKLAYCAQKPWLPNGTVKEIICGTSYNHEACANGHEAWYDELLALCCLTRDLDALAHGDQTEIGSHGINLSGGQKQRITLARALYAKGDILLLDDIFSGLDGVTEQTVFQHLFDGQNGLIRRSKTTVVLVSNSSQYFHLADHVVVLGNNGIVDQGPWQDISDKTMSVPKISSLGQSRDGSKAQLTFDKLSAQVRAIDDAEDDLTRQTGDSALYGYYLSAAGRRNIFLLISCTASYAFFIHVQQYWLKLWTEAKIANTKVSICGLLLLSFMSWIATSIQMWIVIINLAPQSGFRLHQRLLNIIMNAQLSYFSKTDAGSNLNRFSQDVQLIDKQLPSALQTVITQICKLIMQLILLCLAERWLMLLLPPCMLLVYVIQKVYLRTSRQLRFLELQSRAAVFTNFLETIEGIETIRAFGKSRAMVQRTTQSLDNAQRPEYALLCIQRWLNLVLDLLAAVVAVSAITIAVDFRGRVSGAQVGIALNMMLVANTTLLRLVESWTTLETSLGAIARLKTLEQTTSAEDQNLACEEPPQYWPSKGRIEIENISASYQSDSVTLQDINLTIPAGQKVVICGRTGSGKSTLILVLTRLLETHCGKIVLDGVNIKHVKLELLRQRCFVTLSQDVLLLPNETLRFNLDPDSCSSNQTLIEALSNTELWPHFAKGTLGTEDEQDAIIDMSSGVLGEHPVLDQNVSSFRELSVGQYQLFAFCRALIKVSLLRRENRMPIIILDEVTSALDTTTESTIHRIIDDDFIEKGHTVIMVAHRLSALDDHKNGKQVVVAIMKDGGKQKFLIALIRKAPK